MTTPPQKRNWYGGVPPDRKGWKVCERPGCGKKFRIKKVGRPRRYHSLRCQEKHWVQRRRAEAKLA